MTEYSLRALVVGIILAVYGSLVITLSEDLQIPRECTFGCPITAPDHTLFKGLLECTYTNGRLTRSTLRSPNLDRAVQCEISYLNGLEFSISRDIKQ